VIGALADIIRGYLDLHWRINPVEASYAGRHEHDGAYARYDRESLREYIAALRSYTSALEEATADSLDDEIDQTAALHSARHELLVLERERPFAFNPAFHLSQALHGIFVLLIRNEQDPPRRAAALLERLGAIPEALEQAVEELTEPSAVLVETAIAMLQGGLTLIRDGLDDPAIDLSALDPLELANARAVAVDALTEFGDALALMRERAKDSHAIGRALFDQKLHTAHMIQENADELLRYAERLRAEVVARLERLAGEIEPGARWQDVALKLREDMPARESAIEEYAAATREARDFTIARGLARVPEVELHLAPTPDFMRVLYPVAAYLEPGAFDEEQRGLFFVTLPQPYEEWRTHSRAELPSIALHEGVPGHHLQVTVANRQPRVVRRVVSSPVTAEGWALYCETLMAELGFLRTPAERFFQAHHLLWRALRITLDIALHTKGMKVEAATQVLRDELGFDKASALGEVRRYCAHPTNQLCYAVGRREILRLRDDARRERGGNFSLAEFHDALLSYGALPTALARWGMGLS
jgi:uncharacterized protein (DUF885 family)